MAEESNARGRPPVLGGAGRTPTVFVTDAAAEGSHIADTLRTAGYGVVDVPLSMLVARSQVQRPNVVLLDVEAADALEEVGRLRRLPGGGAIDFVYFGTGRGPVRSADEAIANEGSAFFLRPVDVGALVRRVESLTGGPVADVRPSTPPPAIPLGRVGIPPDRSSNASLPSSNASLPGPGLRTPGPPLPMSTPSLADLVDPPRSLAIFGTVSSELQQLLAEAELRAEVTPHPEAPLPTPEEEIEAVLPADVLASLDEPIDSDEDEEHEVRVATGPSGDREGIGTHTRGTTAGGSNKQTTTSRRAASTTPQTHERRVPSEPPAREATLRGSSADRVASNDWALPSTRVERSLASGRSGEPPRRVALPASPSEDASAAVSGLGESREPPSRAARDDETRSPALGVVLLRPLDARRFLADVISSRSSGAVCFEHDRVVRRLVVRDGDLVTAASGADQESLVCFLGARGELPRDEVDRLAAKVPPYGRHAGAALVAHGWLGQEQLWSTLRAHAEWIATSMLRMSGGTAQLEMEPPGRLRSEPSVFGASTGPEVFVELVRRAVSPDEAMDALGGESSRVSDGPMQALLVECALAPAELELVSRSRGGTVGDLLARAPEADVASVLHALALLGVIDVLRAAEGARVSERRGAGVEPDVIEHEALRARVRARLELVDEGDYFSVLGVSRDATSYEVRRAFVELRRAFEPTRILSPHLVDLAEDVRKIVMVLEEAYEILRDAARRERYRRAIEARPD